MSPDGLLTSGPRKDGVDLHPQILDPDPFASDDCLDVFSLYHQFPPPVPEELNKMNASEDEPSSGLNGRLRPRKSNIPSLQSNKIGRKLDGKVVQEKPKRTSTLSKASPSKSDDLTNKSELLPTPHHLCPYCDNTFVSKQALSKHGRRLHLSASKPESVIGCIFCNHAEADPNEIIRHMVDSHPNQYFACLDCQSRFPSTTELAEHKLNVCEKQKLPYRSKLRQKPTKKGQHSFDDLDDFRSNDTDFSGHGFNGIVISCELKPSHVHDDNDIEDNITTNLILPPNKNLSNSTVLEKNAVITIDDIQWNKRIPSNFSFHNTDADQILSRLGVVHRSPKTGDSTKKGWFKAIENATQKFEKCFDTSFYSKVASNVHENLTKFLDGTFNFNPDPDATIKTRKSKNSVVINTAEGFPILLACEQYSRNSMDGYMPRAIAPKHKWKRDNLDNVKHFNPDQIKRDTHANNCIITLVSNLDIWTQLRMRRKYEDKYNITPIEKKSEKKKLIAEELKAILESRELPATNSQIVKCFNKPATARSELDFPTSLGLTPSAPTFNIKPSVLSGEWVRPRCYVCCACGAQTRDSRALSSHISSQHQNAQVQHYEIVGESLLKADILKHLYVPPSPNSSRTRPPRGFRDCTKCKKPITIEDMHQHMLDCAGDTPTVRRKCRYRPFGVRRRRPRLPDNRIRKKIRNDIRTRQTRPKNRMRPRPKTKTDVGDAETIRKMLADLPAKRHRGMVVNQMNPNLRPRRKLDKQRAKMLLKRRISDDHKMNKSRTNKKSANSEISENSDGKKDIANKDQEVAKPLRSRIKRVNCTIGRPKESLTRKAVLKKPMRKKHPLIEKKEDKNDVEPDIPSSSPEHVKTDELSLENTQKRININSDPQNTREHSSGRNNGSYNRDNERPGCSGENGNSRNEYAPAQNVPLKHSIARLTANSETHDKSVQFHHLFLVQQECNNVNEHVPSGQRVLFENEAIVTKLDKPPLHFNQKPPPPDPGQKNKSNKPRKGLNDCIAMLKNKLVDTDPKAPLAHVSVQCGSDEPINSNVTMQTTPPVLPTRHQIKELTTSVVPQVTAAPADNRRRSSAEAHFRDILPKSISVSRVQHSPKDVTRKRQNEKAITQWRPVNYDLMMSKYNDNNWPRREVSRHRSVSQTENMLIPPQYLTPLFDRNEAVSRMLCLPKEAYILPPHRVIRPRAPRVSKQITPNRGIARRKTVDVHNHSEFSIRTMEAFEKSRKELFAIQRQQDLRLKSLAEVNPSSYSQVIRKPRNNSFNVDVNVVVQPTQVETQSKKDKTVKKPVSGCTEKNINITAIDIPPAHSNINVDSILTAPLDLSGKSVKSTASCSSKRIEIINYDETLDLSKNARINHDRRVGDEDVVDLRVKHHEIHSTSSISEISSFNQQSLNNVISTNLGQLTQCVPTDLSLKRKEVNMCTNLSPTSNAPGEIPHRETQNLSSPQIIIVDNNEHLLLSRRLEQENMLPTDLSAKTSVNSDQVASSLAAITDESNATVTSNNIIEAETPTDLSDTGIGRRENNTVMGVEPTFRRAENEDSENINNTVSPDHSTSCTVNVSENQIQRPIYDPTLRIPQFKITPTVPPVAFASTSGEVHSVDVNSLTASSTEAENYPSHTAALNSNFPAYTSHCTTTMNNNTIIASIEAQERITYSFTKIPVSNIAGSLPVYNLLNHGITTPFTTYESTRPLYTLANSGMSGTRIDTAEPTTSSNSLVSIPSTSITSTTSVYTLAGATIVTPFNYETMFNPGPSTSFQQPEIESPSMGFHTSNLINTVPEEIYIGGSPIVTGPNVYTIEEGFSTSPKLVMPNEVRTTLAVMPYIRRNQLMDVLPKYLYSIRPITILPKIQVSDRRKRQSRRSTEQRPEARQDQEEVTPEDSSEIVEKTPQPEIADLCATEEFLVTCQARGLLTNKLSVVYQKTPIIDLTVNEVVTNPVSETDTNINAQVTSAQGAHSNVTPRSSTQRTNNDQTASLRAVRIKAPSERQRSKLLCNQLPQMYNGDNITTVQHSETEVPSTSSCNNSGLSDQQAEASSAQQFNTNTVSSHSLISEPNDIERSGRKIMADNGDNELNQLMTQDVDISSCRTNGLNHANFQQKIVHNQLATNASENDESTQQSLGTCLVPEVGNNIQNTSNLHATSGRSPPANLPIELQQQQQQSPPILSNGIQDQRVTKSDDDDSDDDISLAVIIRQKQLLQKSSKIAKKPKPKKDNKRKVGKTKRGKKKAKGKKARIKKIAKFLVTQSTVEDNQEIALLTTDTNNQNVSSCPYDIANIEDNSDPVTEPKNKRYKRKGKKDIPVKPSNLKMIDDTERIDQYTIKPIEISKTGTGNSVREIQNQEDKDISHQAPFIITSSNNVQDRINSIHQNIIVTENSREISKEREINTHILQGSKSSTVVQFESYGNKKTVVCVDFKEKNVVENVCKSKQSSFNMVKSQVENYQVPSVSHDNSQADAAVVGDSKMEFSNTNSVTNVSDIDIVTSLRRSRRGKSLYVDKNDQKEPPVYPEKIVEHKIPLTKKQLIFSKLLLDEKNLIRNALMAEQKQSTPVNNNDTEQATIIDNTLLGDKGKPSKRKQSPPPRKQIKKKKSLDSFKNITKIVEDSPEESDSESISGRNNDELHHMDNILNSNPSKGGNQSVHSEKDIITGAPKKGNTVNYDDIDRINTTKDEIMKPSNTEKRKIMQVATTCDTTQSSKAKKSKLDNKNDDLVKPSSEEVVTHWMDDIPESVAYDLPIAARRNRSKSVVVKSSGTKLYDPYDIDLEDMGDTTEPLGKQWKFSMKSVVNANPVNEYKSKTVTICDIVSISSSSIKPPEANSCMIYEKGRYTSEYVSDSDESSKSDVPLKKYVEEKERRNARMADKRNSKQVLENSTSINEPELKQTKRKKKTKATPAVSVQNVQSDNVRNEVEELRSQQFMESFGFFSQRIPRKCNLLASKKIAETFHIIANESDDSYYEPKERVSKARAKNTKPVECVVEIQAKPVEQSIPEPEDTGPHDCYVCGKQFRRIDNLMRHQMTLAHVSKLSEIELKVETTHIPEEPNCLIGFKHQLVRRKNFEIAMKIDKTDIRARLPFTTMKQMVFDVYKRVRTQGVKWGVYTLGEVLFVSLSQLLNDNSDENLENVKVLMCSCANYFTQYSIGTIGIPSDITYITKTRPGLPGHPLPSGTSGLAKYHFSQSSGRRITYFTQSLPSTSGVAANNSKSSTITSSALVLATGVQNDEEASVKEINDLEQPDNEKCVTISIISDSADMSTAQNTVNTEESSLISTIKETSDTIKNSNKTTPILSNDITNSPIKVSQSEVVNEEKESNCTQEETNKADLKPVASKGKKHVEKKNPDIIESIDIFEDKFDKIKRKCRSQAAAAKQVQAVVEPAASNRGRKKSDKKKTRKPSTKQNQNAVLTKGALKGYEGLKVSISTSDINMSAIVPPIAISPKKKKRTSSKKKRDRKYSEPSQKCESNRTKEVAQKNVDVYEFMDNEEPEVFEFRPSTVMERFKQMNSRELPSTSKVNTISKDIESSDSGSDGDDFVYMSDDYVASDEETENSLSCDRPLLKRKDVIEKNAVMGKIFRHNAVRERKGFKNKESIIEKPGAANPLFDKRAELDELFDKLLEEAHSASKSYELLTKKAEHTKRNRSPSPAPLKSDCAPLKNNRVSPSRESSPSYHISSSRYKDSFDPEPSTSKRYDDLNKYEELSKDYVQPKIHKSTKKKNRTVTSKNVDFVNEEPVLPINEDLSSLSPKVKTYKNRSPSKKKEKSPGTSYEYNYKADYLDQDTLFEDAGVARQRARRKCTVGKQNILAETWSSESEPDGIPTRPNSTESMVLGCSRKKKGKKKDGQNNGNRKGNIRNTLNKKTDVASTVKSSTNRSHGAIGNGVGGRSGGTAASRGGTSAASHSLSLPGPSGIAPRLRPSASFWTPDGEEGQEHVQQHGWIVGDSHKKLVTMLAHAKGRKRNNDDESHLIE